MAGRSVSPGAALLRSSRMFSMPTPIPAPPGDYSSITKFHSPTATIAYPTHLTVTTTPASRANGDWGFKRPLPLKSTTGTTHPLIRVRQVDSIEHITDFQSASDHTITLRKFQEMSLPISMPVASATDLYSSSTFPTSVFEEEADVTALSDKKKVELANKRWRFSGPWLAGMAPGDFNRFLEKEVRSKRSEFRAFLKKTLAAEMTENQARKAREAGETEPPEVSANDITEGQLTNYQRELRQDRMNLYNLVSQFLDLAPVDLNTTLRHLGALQPGKPTELERGSPYGANGPPITHPSAGISYLRTRNFQENHPLYGPQKHHAPIKARILKPAHLPHSAMGNPRPSIGVAGFVASLLTEDSVFNTTKQRNASKFHKSLHSLELQQKGGAKLYVQPTKATVDSSGRVRVSITDTNEMSEVVQKEMVGESAVFDQAAKAVRTPEIPRNPRNEPRSYGHRPGNRVSSSARNYGLGLN
ncbi:mitochondrial ribosomal protein MRP51 [Hypomontagnella monticulosa]|nr:mitochondrial ribosomal protein MRP51 [Hypomontagnella monticulosa]